MQTSPMITRSSRWVDAVEEKNRDTGELPSNNDAAADACYTKAQSLREVLPPLYLATIKDFLRFHVAISRERIDDTWRAIELESAEELDGIEARLAGEQ